MPNANPNRRAITTRQLTFGAVFLLCLGLMGGWLVHGYLESQRLIKTTTEPAAQLTRDDSRKAKEPKLFITTRQGIDSPSADDENAKTSFYVDLIIDEKKCLDYYGEDGVMQCEAQWSKLEPARAQTSITPAIPGAEWKFTHQSDYYNRSFTLRYLFNHESSQSKQTYTITLPSDLGEQVVSAAKTVSLSTPAFEPTITQWSFQADPQNPRKSLVSGQITFDWIPEQDTVKNHLTLSIKPKDATQTAPSSTILSEPVLTFSPDGRKIGFVAEVTKLPQQSELVTLGITPGIARKHSKTISQTTVQQATTVPGQDVFVSLDDAQSFIATDKDNLQQQVLLLEFTRPVKVTDVQAATQAILLPRFENAEAKKQQTPTNWRHYLPTSTSFTKALEQAQGRHLPLKPIESASEYSTTVSFTYTIPAEHRHDALGQARYFYLTNQGGADSTAGYPLAPFAKTMPVAPLEKALYIMQKGSILSLNASKTLALFSRGLNDVTLNAWQVRPQFINLLVTQSYGDLNAIEMNSYNLDFSHLAEKHQLTYKPLRTSDNEPDYHALDLSPLLAGGGKGLFHLELKGAGLSEEGIQEQPKTFQKTFLLVTDLALNIKEASDGTREIFVNSFASGTPCEQVKIEVIGRNGLPLFSTVTNAAGNATIPDIKGFSQEKTAVALVATLGDDYTFMPLQSYHRNVSYLEFPSTSGRFVREGGISAYTFAERGIFRPGEELRFGIIVKNTSWDNAGIKGLPLRVRLMNPRHDAVYDKIFTQDSSGLTAIAIPTEVTDPTGQYSLEVRLDDTWLGGTSVQVEEFQPETIKVETRFNKVPQSGHKGWVVPENLTLTATVNTLYGAPAVDNTVKFFYSLTPTRLHFKEYDDYRFFDPGTATRFYTSDTQSAQTNAQGEVEFAMNFDGYASGSYSLQAVTEAFEASGGRGVTRNNTLLVSPHAVLVGWKSDLKMSYVPVETKAEVHFLAVNNTLTPTALDNLEITISEVQHISSLVKTDAGNYRYDTARRLTETHKTPAALDENGLHFTLPTDKTGEFELSLKDDSGQERCNLTYIVAGASQRLYGLERDTNVRIHLDKNTYEAGETIEIFVSAPYAGTGLITLESDKVFASQWFIATTSDSVQHITVPDTIEGRAFVNVALVRDIHSDAVYSSPFTYAVVPFMANLQRRDQKLTLEAPEQIAPGETLTMRLSSQKPGKALVFAVDEGILQLTNYLSPSALHYFLKQTPLSVATMQNWSLIMPEYHLMHSLFGGDEMPMSAEHSAYLNPFRRKAEASVVYWSEVIDVNEEGTELEWQVPSYFNGSLRLMAVSAGDASIGDTVRKTIVKGPLVLSPNLPVAVAPGDEFDVTVAIANNIEGSGDNLEITLLTEIGEGLAFIEQPQNTLTVAENQQGKVHFRLKATEQLGESTLTLTATTAPQNTLPHKDTQENTLEAAAKENDDTPESQNIQTEQADQADLTTQNLTDSKDATKVEEVTVKRSISLSVRPASPKVSAFSAGFIKNKDQTIPVGRTLYPQFATVEASVSGLPLPLVDGLASFLTTFPHGCTEQVLSAAFPYSALNKSSELLPMPAGETPADLKNRSEKAVQRALTTLREREILPGRFSLWPYEGGSGYSFLTVYGLDYLITTREAGFKVPQDLIENARLQTLRIIQTTPTSQEAVRIASYAAWVYTRSGKTLTELPRLVKDMDAHVKDWRKTPSAALIAACYQMMQQHDKAQQLLAGAKAISPDEKANTVSEWGYTGWFTSRLWDNSLLLSAYAGAFPQKLKDREAQKALVHIINDVGSGIYTTASAAQAVRALADYAMAHMEQSPELVLEAIDYQKKPLPLEPRGTYVKRLSADNTVQAFRFGGAKELYWQINSNGFDKEPLPILAQKLMVTGEYIPVDGKPLHELAQGDEVYVLLRAKATEPIDNVAITSLLPGGFEMVISKGGALVGTESDSEYHDRNNGHTAQILDTPSPQPHQGQIAAQRAMLEEAGIDGYPLPVVHAERREDRMVVFTSLSSQERLFVYRVKAINKGKFTLPATSAAALYDPDARANTAVGSIEVK